MVAGIVASPSMISTLRVSSQPLTSASKTVKSSTLGEEEARFSGCVPMVRAGRAREKVVRREGYQRL